MSALSAALVPATFDSSAYLGSLLKERTDRMPRDRDHANEQFRRAVRERVMSRRRELGYNRDHMARLLNITAQGYAKWERDGVPLERLTSLAECLGVSPEWILHGDAPSLAELQQRLAGLEDLIQRLLLDVSRPESDRGTG